jgi:hypothetical protein
MSAIILDFARRRERRLREARSEGKRFANGGARSIFQFAPTRLPYRCRRFRAAGPPARARLRRDARQPGVRLADRVDADDSGVEHAGDAVGERQDAHRVQVGPEDPVHEGARMHQPQRLAAIARAAGSSGG